MYIMYMPILYSFVNMFIGFFLNGACWISDVYLSIIYRIRHVASLFFFFLIVTSQTVEVVREGPMTQLSH